MYPAISDLHSWRALSASFVFNSIKSSSHDFITPFFHSLHSCSSRQAGFLASLIRQLREYRRSFAAVFVSWSFFLVRFLAIVCSLVILVLARVLFFCKFVRLYVRCLMVVMLFILEEFL